MRKIENKNGTITNEKNIFCLLVSFSFLCIASQTCAFHFEVLELVPFHFIPFDITEQNQNEKINFGI